MEGTRDRVVPLSSSSGVAPYRALARSMPAGFVLLFDADLRILVAEGTELATFGYAPADLEGHRIHDVFPAWLVEELVPRYRAALAGQRVSWERALAGRIFQLAAGPAASEDDPADGPTDGPTDGTAEGSGDGAVSAGMVVALDMTEQRRSERSWAALHRVATEVARAESSPEQIAARIVEELHVVFTVDSAAVVRFTDRTSADVLAMAPDLPDVGDVMTFSANDSSAVARVAATGSPALVVYTEEEGGLGRRLSRSGLSVGAAAPIHRHGVLWGAVALGASQPRSLDGRTLEQLGSFADLVELAIGNSEAWATLTQEATTDALTGLPNRRLFTSHLEHEIERARRHGSPLSVAVLDLDHFKAVNDRFGHPVGDRVLAEFGRRISAASRGGELVARIGGEEFGLLLPGTTGEDAVRAVTRLCAASLTDPFAEVGLITASAGVSSLVDGDPDQLLARADDALYAAKRRGRDRVERWIPVATV